MWLGAQRGFPVTRSQCFVLVQECFYVCSRKKKHPSSSSPFPVSYLFLSLLIRTKKIEIQEDKESLKHFESATSSISFSWQNAKKSCKLVLGWGGLGWVSQGFGQWDQPLSLCPPSLFVGPTETPQCSAWGAPRPPAHSCEMWRTVLDVPLLKHLKRFRWLQGPHLPHHMPLSVQKILPKHTRPSTLHSLPLPLLLIWVHTWVPAFAGSLCRGCLVTNCQ